MALPRWLAILIFALIAGGIAHVLHRVLTWRGLSKDQITWAIFASLVAFFLMYLALVVLGFA